MNTNARKMLVPLLLGTLAFALSACNTMRGVGEDTEAAGDKIQEKADAHIDDKDKTNDRRASR